LVRVVAINQRNQGISESLDFCGWGVGFREVQPGCGRDAVGIVAGSASGALQDRIEAGFKALRLGALGAEQARGEDDQYEASE
jgi:hypothetical protein